MKMMRKRVRKRSEISYSGWLSNWPSLAVPSKDELLKRYLILGHIKRQTADARDFIENSNRRNEII
jgi:hypothetical protein